MRAEPTNYSVAVATTSEEQCSALCQRLIKIGVSDFRVHSESGTKWFYVVEFDHHWMSDSEFAGVIGNAEVLPTPINA